jgi:tRNA(Arg) A34 adenosine deaminase TadA
MTFSPKVKEYYKNGLQIHDFRELGDYAEAGLLATELALDRAEQALNQGRIPVAGAAVARQKNGQLKIIAVGNNGRVPGAADARGYPTDHGETAAIRKIGDVAGIDWSQVVFATTLSPCIMCNRSLRFLHTLGLNKITCAAGQAKGFEGTIEQFEAMGFQVVSLNAPKGVELMQAFANKHPWDWAADIGEIPPAHPAELVSLPLNPMRLAGLMEQALATIDPSTERYPTAALVVDHRGQVISRAADERDHVSGNPVFSSVMLAMGRAGSAVNLRDCLVFIGAASESGEISLEQFGHASLGACELFRPAWVVSNHPLSRQVSGPLNAAHVKVENLSKSGET